MNVRQLHIRFACALVLVCLAVPALADAPAGYYDSVDFTSPATLRQTVHNVIDNHTRFPYTSSSTDTWDILEQADEDPYDGSRILDVYHNRVWTKQGGGNSYYNREHTWPNSYGFSSSGSIAYTDCHHLFLCDISYNSSRANYPYDDCVSSCSSRSTDFYDGASGTNYYNTSQAIWQTWDGRKGDVARAQFYMDVRYAGDASGEPDLVLTDNRNLIVTTSSSPAYMGMLSTLIQWHKDDPVDQRERDRNDVIYSYQGNRNPFIDHPEWVAGVFEGIISDVPDVRDATSITSVYPNPFNPTTEVAFSVARAGRVVVTVHGMDGRRVRTLLTENCEAGPRVLGWDGRDDTGRRVASGAWFMRLVGPGATDTQKVMLVK
ncbi:MAG: hypothetical protein GY838_14545 [bacterium]|nr:hypothetical protein [bacterium]